ncbi:MAG TPA: zinc-binding dehydrogenase [Bacillota bacterium]
MKAFVHEYGTLKLKEMDERVAGDKEVVVALRTAGLNRRDLYIPNRRGNKAKALILGSDGAGVIEEMGKDVTRFQIGDEVIVNPALGWFENSAAPPKGFDILGMPNHGTFAEKIVISEEQVEKKPTHLSWEEAGVLSLSALTAYRALFTKGKLTKVGTVFIPGAGSGVATYLISFAKNIGAKVIVTSRSEKKRKLALQLGADVAIDTNEDWNVALHGETIDLIIDSVGRRTFNQSLDVLKHGGRMVVFGATTEDVVDFDLRAFFYGQYELVGSTMGSREELRNMLNHIKTYNTRPIVDSVYSLDDIQTAFDYLKANKQFGKIAIQID